MARVKKTPTPAVKFVRVRASYSFNGFVIGEEAETELTEPVLALIANGNLTVVRYGEDPAGPAATEPGDQGGSAPDPEAEGPAGAEPSEDPGTG